jgi:hypothetical protein
VGKVFYLGQASNLGVKAGHSLVISKTIDIRSSYSGDVVEATDFTRYWLREWNWEFTTPGTWPPKPCEVWNSAGMDYAVIEKSEGCVLEPMENNGIHQRVYPCDYEKFLRTHPVLVRGRNG